jgi:hypothetical protein
MGLVNSIDTDIDYQKIWDEVYNKLLTNPVLEDLDQISLTSVDGNDDWLCSVGRLAKLQYPERYYSTLNKTLVGTELEKLLSRYPEYYRWRLMRLEPKKTYSVHRDGNDNADNIRMHIPLQTNEGCFLCFYVTVPLNKEFSMVKHEHLATGNSYTVNTSGFHTAVNYGHTNRYHIVGVKYENSNNRTQ